MRPLLQFVLFTAVAVPALSAGEAAEAWGTLALGDGQRLIERWRASEYARWWDHAALAKARAAVDAASARAEAAIGIAPLALLAACRGLDVRFLGIRDHDRPMLVAQAVLGDQAAPLLARLRQALAARRPDAPPADVFVANASEAFSLTDDRTTGVVARYDGTLVFSLNLEQPARPLPPSLDDADLVVAIDGAAMKDGLAQLELPGMDGAGIASVLRGYGGTSDYRLWIDHDGLRTRTRQEGYAGMTLPIDRTLFARLPAANTVFAAVFGVDGKAIWTSLRDGLLTLAAKRQGGGTADEIEARIDDQLAAAGLPVGIAELADGFVGSCAFAITNAAPFPGVALALPRSEPLDRLIESALRLQQQKPPAEGASVAVQLGVPLPIYLGRDVTHWLLTSDVTLANGWLRKPTTGWADNPAGKLALAKAPANATAVSGFDLAQAMRMATPYVAMGLQQLPQMPAEDKQAITTLMSDLGDDARPEYSVAWEEDGALISEYRGLTGGLTGLYLGAIGAAIAIPNLLESRVDADESAAKSALTSGILPAEIQFQAGGYLDQDGDGIGEYGALGELAGRCPVAQLPAGQLQLLAGPVASGASAGYRFRIDLPDAADGVVAAPAAGAARDLAPGAADAQEKAFVAYAWPTDTSAGRLMFAIDQRGTLYQAPWVGEEPEWNALFGGGGWDAAPNWAVVGQPVAPPLPQAPVDAEMTPADDATLTP